MGRICLASAGGGNFSIYKQFASPTRDETPKINASVFIGALVFGFTIAYVSQDVKFKLGILSQERDDPLSFEPTILRRETLI